MMGSHGVAALLVSAAVGYWVLTLAAKEKEGTKKIGHFVGLIIIVVSLLGVACKVYFQINGGGCPPGKYYGMGWKGKKACMMGHPGCVGGTACVPGKASGAACPMTGNSMGTPADSQ